MKMAKGLKQGSRNVLSMLTEQEVKRIHNGSVHVLQRAGYKVHDPEACNIFAEAGVTVKQGVVYIPESLIVDALESAPERVTLYSPNGDVLQIWGDNVYYGAGSHTLDFWDYETSHPREATRQDVANLTIIADYLPSISAVLNHVHISDVPANLVCLFSAEAIALNTTKHLWAYPGNFQEQKIWVELAEVISEEKTLAERPILTVDICPTSPLTLHPDGAQGIIHAARKRIPLVIRPCAHSGMSAPFTLAGTMVVQNAEALAAMVLHQAANKGAPFVYAEGSTIWDARSGEVYCGSMERPVMLNAWAEMGRMYKLPLASNMGLTISEQMDVQNGAEKGTQFFASLLSGFNLLMGAGVLNGVRTMSCEQMVIDHDLFERVNRFMKGMRVDEETLALDTIIHVGPGGNYMTEPHTLEWLRKGEHYYSEIFRPAGGMGRVSRTALERAHEKVEKILKEHTPAVTEHTAQQIKEYVKEKRVQIERES